MGLKEQFASIHAAGARPLICGVVSASDTKGISVHLERAAGLSLDAVEWRVDYFENCGNEAEVLSASEIFSKFSGLHVIVTFRRPENGGKYASSADYRLRILKCLAKRFDAVDIDYSEGREAVAEVIIAANASGSAVIVSKHDFHSISSESNFRELLAFSQSAGADAVKYFATAANETEALEFMFSCREICGNYKGLPAIFATMGAGLLGRAAGGYFGSRMTYGALGKPSANGQIDAGLLKQAVDLIYPDS